MKVLEPGGRVVGACMGPTPGARRGTGAWGPGTMPSPATGLRMATVGNRKAIWGRFLRDCGRGGHARVRSGDGSEENEDTELIFKLERHGNGWGEEILPRLVVQRRPVSFTEVDEEEAETSVEEHQEPRQSNGVSDLVVDENSTPSTSKRRRYRGHTSGISVQTELEDGLYRLGLSDEDVSRVIRVAVAWRVTDGGLVLVDRRRRAKASRNLRPLVCHLSKQLALLDPHHRDVEQRFEMAVGELIKRVPLLILCNVDGPDSTWERRAVELAARFWFKNVRETSGAEEHEQVLPPPSGELSRWMQRARRHKALGKLSSDQSKLLKSIGFDFGLGLTSGWESMFDQLLDFILEHGHSQVKPERRRGASKGLSLHEWTELQRIAYAAGRLADEHVERLESINFEWSAMYISSWLKHCHQYKSIGSARAWREREREGTLLPGSRLWVLQQQVLWYSGKLLPERETLLMELGFEFNPYRVKFREMCEHLGALQERYGVRGSMLALLVRLYDSLMLPPASAPDSGEGNQRRVRGMTPHHVRQIGRWVKIQITLKRNGLLSDSDAALLDGLGVLWEGLEWQHNFECLLKFRLSHGHCDVGKESHLNSWVVNMRQNRHDLPSEYKTLLNMVGFTWERKGAWTRTFAQLSRYQEENGHVLIPEHSLSGNGHLSHLNAWLVSQRALWRKGKLSNHQIQRLEAIGVTK